MLTRHGVKLLDFGLAKWSRPTAGYALATDGAPEARPPGAPTLTAEGTILGTLHYMAPEQLEGKAVDARADIFAFGALMFEMLTGRKAFDGGSAAAIMAAVLNTEPPALEMTQPLAPRSLDRVVRRCLAKDPDDRWQSARDLADQLKWIAAEPIRLPAPSGVLPPPVPAPPGPWTWARPAAVAALAAALAWFGWSAWPRPVVAPSPVTRFMVLPTTAAALGAFAVAPDGREIAYVGGGQTLVQRLLYVRRFDQMEDVLVPGTEGVLQPFYSPDGQWVGFMTQNRLMKVQPRAGTAPVVLCECVDRAIVNGAAWLDDGTIAFTRPDCGLQRISAEGGEPSDLTPLRPRPRRSTITFRRRSRDGARCCSPLTPRTARSTWKCCASTPAIGRCWSNRPTTPAICRAAISSMRDLGVILAAPFDLARLETTGPTVTLLEGVAGNPSGGYGGYTLSADGTLVYRAAPSLDGRVLTWVTRQGLELPVPLTPRAFSTPRVSPDGTRLAFAVTEAARRDIWIYELGTEKLTDSPATATTRHRPGAAIAADWPMRPPEMARRGFGFSLPTGAARP